MNFKFIICVIWLLGLYVPAQAAFERVNSPAFGVNALTFDSGQNLYWLAPSVTGGQSFAQVQERLVTDNRFSGFRFATVAELATLYSDFGIPNINDFGLNGNGTANNVEGAMSLQSFLGITYAFQNSGISLIETAGFVGSPFISPVNGLLSVYIGDVTIRDNINATSGPFSFPLAYVATSLSSGSSGTEYFGVGSWLVSNIPEPHSIDLLSVGLVACTLVTLRKRGNCQTGSPLESAPKEMPDAQTLDASSG